MATALLQSIDFKLHDRPAPGLLPAGIPSFDAAFSGIPRGCVTDIFGPASSGRTSLMLALVAQATAHEEFCAVVDASDAFDPASAAAAGIALERLLWIRCGGNAEHALKATDLLLQAGGFGLVAMDLGDIAPETARRISLASWYRLRRAVENTPTALVVIERAPHARACATLALECARNRIQWSGVPGCSQLLRGLAFAAERRKPLRPASAVFEAHALNSGDALDGSSGPLGAVKKFELCPAPLEAVKNRATNRSRSWLGNVSLRAQSLTEPRP